MKRAATFMLCSFLFASSLMAQDTSFSLAPLELVPTSILADEVPIAQQEEIQSIISSDIVREQLTNGRVERQVALDPQGNFVNHGSYTQFDRSGKVLLTGQYRMGVRIGVWTKNVTDRNAPVLKVYPFSNGKLPIKSTVEFVDGKMHGSWSIEDADNRVLSQIDFSHGVRSGKSVWLHPSGGVYRHCEYSNGHLDGPFIELDIKGKTVREIAFVSGKRTSSDVEYFKNRTKKAEYSVWITMISQSQDDFDSLTFYEPQASKETVRHGEFTVYHANGKPQMRGNYERGELSGPSESWYADGQRESLGEYSNGSQTGKWTWWHANGMRKAEAVFRDGQVDGEMLTWDETGNKTNKTQLAKHPVSDSILR